jgi:hypothetical protein
MVRIDFNRLRFLFIDDNAHIRSPTQLAAKLTETLSEVTNEFLRRENRGRREVLAKLQGPSIVPE